MRALLQAAFRGRLARGREGVAALEFAIVLPVLIAAMAGLYDLTTAFMAWQRLTASSQAVAEVATALAASADDSNTLNFTSAGRASSAIYAYLPATVPPASRDYGVVLSSIVMTPVVAGCTSNCSYTAHVAWSGVFQGTGKYRPCDSDPNIPAITQVSDADPSDPATLPADAYAAAPLLVADVTYQFKPLFLFYITGDIFMRRSAYYPIRAGRASEWVHFDDPNGAALRCPGWPA